MKKEVILAITIGFVLGLVITFGIWVANRSLKQTSTTAATPTPIVISITPAPTNQVTNNQLTITSPDDESVVAVDKITVTGKTSPNSTVAILYEDGQTFVTSDAEGKFSVEVPLVGGYNEITATSEDSSQTITVTYSTAKI